MPTKKKAPPRPTPDLEYIAPELRSLAVSIKDLTPDPKNARKHGSRNMDAITASLRRFGMRQPIVVQKSGDSMIVRAGNGRLAVAKQLGWTHLPAVVYEEKDDEAVAYAIADNRTAELAEWDWEALTEAFEDIGEPELLSSIGFSEKELSFLTIGSSTSSLTDEESGADATDSRKSSSKEVDLTEFTDAAFDHTCPRCKFSFND